VSCPWHVDLHVRFSVVHDGKDISDDVLDNNCRCAMIVKDQTSVEGRLRFRKISKNYGGKFTILTSVFFIQDGCQYDICNCTNETTVLSRRQNCEKKGSLNELKLDDSLKRIEGFGDTVRKNLRDYSIETIDDLIGLYSGEKQVSCTFNHLDPKSRLEELHKKVTKPRAKLTKDKFLNLVIKLYNKFYPNFPESQTTDLSHQISYPMESSSPLSLMHDDSNPMGIGTLKEMNDSDSSESQLSGCTSASLLEVEGPKLDVYTFLNPDLIENNGVIN